MSFLRYERYKDSGVEWLGEVPEHWKVKRLGFLCEKIGSGKTPLGGSTTYTDSGILFIRSQNVYDEGLKIDDVVFITEQADSEMSNSRVVSGDILLNITGASLGRSCLVPNNFGPANVNQHVCIIRLKEINFKSYLAMVMKSSFFKMQIDAIQNGAAREGLNFEQISKLSLVLPPIEEQSKIATFLDRETAKIDELIAEQQRLIELLKEKRQAVISHAVTKGLNPNAPMKDSGVEWLREVPEHWELSKLKHFANFIGGGTPSRDNLAYWNGNIPWISPKDMKNEILYGAEEYITEEGLKNSSSSLVSSGRALMVVRSGILKHTIPVAINKVPVALNQDMKALDFADDSCLSSFFLRWVQGLNIVLLTAWAKQGATVESIEQAYLAETVVPLPPIEEQKTIVAFLDRETAKFDELCMESEQAITLLQERRITLISDAVTGKINVTNTFEGIHL